MKIWKISAAGYVVGAVVDHKGTLDAAGALTFWNNNNTNYQGDTAYSIVFLEYHD